MDFANNFHYPRFTADRSSGTLVGVAHPGGFTLVRFIWLLVGSMRYGVLLKLRTGARVILIVMNQIRNLSSRNKRLLRLVENDLFRCVFAT